MTEPNRAPTAPLYAELPYPGDGVVRTTSARMLKRNVLLHAAHLLQRPTLRIADIGCGTGEATCGVPRLFPAAQVVGVDINPASLALAQKLADRSAGTVQLVRADITADLRAALEAAGALPPGGTFDIITSFGVLHHLDDPAVGFARLRGLIAADGLCMTYMYSRRGRWSDIAVRALLDRAFSVAQFAERAEAVRRLGLSRRHSLWSFLGGLRNRLRFGPAVRPLELLQVYLKRNNLVHLSDTFSNPREHLYDFGEVRELCTRTGWVVLGLASGAGLPVRPEEHTRDPRALELLRRIPEDLLYDYFAYCYRAGGFTTVQRPATA